MPDVRLTEGEAVMAAAVGVNRQIWIYGGDAKQERFLAAHGDRPAAFFVPASELLDVELLGVASDARSTTRA